MFRALLRVRSCLRKAGCVEAHRSVELRVFKLMLGERFLTPCKLAYLMEGCVVLQTAMLAILATCSVG